MTYRIVKSKDAVEGDLIMDRITLRPVPEPRPVEDLTDEEWTEVSMYMNKYSAWIEGMTAGIKKADEIRSRPRETEKYKTLQSIVDQLELCEYQTRDTLHDLTMNAAFLALKNKAAAEAGRGER